MVHQRDLDRLHGELGRVPALAEKVEGPQQIFPEVAETAIPVQAAFTVVSATSSERNSAIENELLILKVKLDAAVSQKECR